jgi:hypothetical protein
VTVSPEVVQPGQKTVVRAALRALGANIDSEIIRFYALPPDANLPMDQVFDRMPVFDEEIL